MADKPSRKMPMPGQGRASKRKQLEQKVGLPGLCAAVEAAPDAKFYHIPSVGLIERDQAVLLRDWIEKGLPS